MTETASTADLPFNVTRKRRSSANGGPSSSAPRALSSRAHAGLGFAANDQAMIEAGAGSSRSAQSPGAWASWAQAGLRFAANDQAMIEARARILDSHSAASSGRYAIRCERCRLRRIRCIHAPAPSQTPDSSRSEVEEECSRMSPPASSTSVPRRRFVPGCILCGGRTPVAPDDDLPLCSDCARLNNRDNLKALLNGSGRGHDTATEKAAGAPSEGLPSVPVQLDGARSGSLYARWPCPLLAEDDRARQEGPAKVTDPAKPADVNVQSPDCRPPSECEDGQRLHFDAVNLRRHTVELPIRGNPPDNDRTIEAEWVMVQRLDC